MRAEYEGSHRTRRDEVVRRLVIGIFDDSPPHPWPADLRYYAGDARRTVSVPSLDTMDK